MNGLSHRTRISASLFFGALGVFAAGLAALAAYESYSIATSTEPITDYVKNEIRRQPMVADLILLAAGILIGHFWTSSPSVVIPEDYP